MKLFDGITIQAAAITFMIVVGSLFAKAAKADVPEIATAQLMRIRLLGTSQNAYVFCYRNMLFMMLGTGPVIQVTGPDGKPQGCGPL